MLVGAALMIGCDADGPVAPVSAGKSATDMFAPTGMRIHPIFTQVEDWTKDNTPDGIEAQLEFQDQFNDPTKAAGRVLFAASRQAKASSNDADRLRKYLQRYGLSWAAVQAG